MKQEWDYHGVIEKFKANRNEELAGPMAAYMKNNFHFLGIKSPLRKQLLREQFAQYTLPTHENLLTEVWNLYNLEEREYQYAAIALLDKMKKHLTVGDLPGLRQLIESKSWWDSVDGIVPIVGHVVKNNRELGEKVMREWSLSENMWTIRASIIFQLKYKQDTNATLLFDICMQHLHSNEFFIQKAIGWALRQYAKTNPDLVKSFVESHPLKPLSRREALKHIK